MNKQTQETMFSSKSAEWETPQDFYNKLDEAWRFTLDPCATATTAKCEKYYTMEDDGLTKDWSGHRVFMNPPYGRSIGKWVKKAYEEGEKENTCVVCLLPARTCTKWFHDYCMKTTAIHFVRGRLKFRNKLVSEANTHSAPFPSMVVIFGGMPHWKPAEIVLSQSMDR